MAGLPMLEGLLETSSTVTLLRIIWARCYYVTDCLDEYYRNSQTCNLINNIFGTLNNLFERSFLGSLTNIKEKEDTQVLNNSLVAGYWVNLLITTKKMILEFADTSKVILSVKEAGKETYRSPVRSLGIIISCALLVNVFLLLLFKRQITLFGWAMRGVFLMIGLGCIFCAVGWFTIEDNSVFIKKILKKK